MPPPVVVEAVVGMQEEDGGLCWEPSSSSSMFGNRSNPFRIRVENMSGDSFSIAKKFS
jgi:hypothetical protein